jgi:hypothetical protein
VVGEAQRAAVEAQLAILGGPWRRWRDDTEPAGEQVVDRARAGGTGKVETVAQLLEDPWVLSRAQVEVAAEEQRRIASPPDRGLRRPQDVGGSELGPIVCRVQVGDAETRRGAGKCHRAALRPPGVDCQPAPLDDRAVAVRLFPVIGG